MMLLGCGFKIALRLDRAEELSDIGYLCQDRHFRQRVQYILSVAAFGAASLIQNCHDTGVRFRADGASKALLELDLHFRHDDAPNEIMQSRIVFLFMLVDGVRECKRQAWNDEQRHAVAGEVHPFPRSAGCQEDGSGGALELPQDLWVVPAHDEDWDAAFEPVETFTDSGHILVRGEKNKGVSACGLQQA
mgnify:CR=1 FL=1